MKLNNKHKGKVHPSPSSSPLSSPAPSTTATTTKDPSSALKLLPAAILALISVLSLEDQEVLAYMITRSLEATANPSHLLLDNKPRRRRTKQASASPVPSAATTPHTPPVFHCGCFDCYTSYWFRWDSSLNRELIHQAIEAFEDHLSSGESEQSRKRGRGKKKSDKKLVPVCSEAEDSGASSPIPADELPESVDFAVEEVVVELVKDGVDEEMVEVATPPDAAVDVEEETAVAGTAVTGGGHKGLARKVLPDVIGLFNSRLWSLWSPNA